jgi:catechol 2,3-dioxygenase-like lactoylglutathione lyase family enzyme
MADRSGVSQYKIISFIPIVDVERAKDFYRDILGLTLVAEDLPFALVFDANGIMLRLIITDKLTSSYGTVAGWQVPTLGSAVRDLQERGVSFERYSFLEQDEQGVWTAPGGAKVAWFKDPDGNVLSLSEHPEAAE